MSTITIQMIVKESGQYDREVIQRLSLTRQGISTVACLEGCSSLIDLDLSHNEVSRIIVEIENFLSLYLLLTFFVFLILS